MTVMPKARIQCDRCRTVFVLSSNKSDYWGSELFDAGWIARPIRGVYRHACRLCADEFLTEIEGRQRRRT